MKPELESEGDVPEVTTATPWRMMTGEHITIAEMQDSHLLNCIRVLRGYSPIGTKWRGRATRRRQWLNAMANEVYRRGLQLDAVREEDPVHE